MHDVLGLMEPTSPLSLDYSLRAEKTSATAKGAGRGLRTTHDGSSLALSQVSGCYINEPLQYLSH